MSGQDVSGADPQLRPLTVLFCDLVGSTQLGQSCSPEDFHELIQDYQRTVSEVIRRYDGQVARTFGDGILVFFGYPVAHERDPEHAVRAGLDALAAIRAYNEQNPAQPPIAIRIGIHTGPAVISRAAAGDGSEIQAVGDAVNLAARLQGVAAIDTVVISEDTLRLVSGLFVTENLGLHEVKGIAEPVRVHRVDGLSRARSRLQASDHYTPFVGRERELEQLVSCWQAVEGGDGRVVRLSAEPGIGKSRLLMVLKEHLGADVPWFECGCSPLNRNTAFAPWLELLRDAMGLAEESDDAQRLAALEKGLDGQDLADAVPVMAGLPNVRLSGGYAPSAFGLELKRKKSIEVISRWCLEQARDAPVVLVVEDLHWADPSSVELLDQLQSRLAGHRILLLMTARPEFPYAKTAAPEVLDLSLEPLVGEASQSIIDSVTGQRPLPDKVRQRLLEQAGGVPLFLEEATRCLLESGQVVERDGELQLVADLDRLSIPPTLQATLLDRLDRLGNAKSLLQVCAVVGREIPGDLLSWVADAAQDSLQQMLNTLISSQLLYAVGGQSHGVYMFKHALIADAAYDSIWKKTRARLHERVATALEEHFPKQAKAQPERLAAHFEAAGNLPRAIEYLKRASRIAARHSFIEAKEYGERALRLQQKLPRTQAVLEEELDLNLNLGNICATVGLAGRARAERAFDRVRELCAQVQDRHLVGRALAGSWTIYFQRCENDAALDVLNKLMQIAQEGGRTRMEILAWFSKAYPHFCKGALAESLRCVRQAEALTQDAQIEASPEQPFIYDLVTPRLVIGSWALSVLGELDEALASADAAVKRADSLRHPYLMAYARVNGMTAVQMMRGDWRFVREFSAKMQAVTQRAGFDDLYSDACWQFGLACCVLGDLEQGLPVCRDRIAEDVSCQALCWHSFLHGQIAECLVRAGRLDEAKSSLKAAFHMVNHYGERFWEGDLYRVQALLLDAERAPAAQIDACFEQAISVSRALGARLTELRAATSLARYWQEQGRGQAALEMLQQARDGMGAAAETADWQEAGALIAELA